MASDFKMPEINSVTIAGRLTRDPDLRYIQTGEAVCEFDIAVDKRGKTPNGEVRKKTFFFTVTSWGKLAEWVGKELKKGRPVHIEGSLDWDDWKNKETGKTRSKTRIKAFRVQTLDWAADGVKPEDHEHKTQPPPDDEMPF